METVQGLLTIALAFWVVTVSPGPANIAVSAVSLQFGRQSGMRFGAGLAVGLAVWGAVAATGMGAVLQSSAQALFVLKIVGGGYLLWLAWTSARSAARPRTGVDTRVSPSRLFRRGLLLNLSNPKAVFAWMAALSMGLGTENSAGALVLATVICCALGFVNYTGHALIFSHPRAMSIYARLGRWIDGVVAGLFAVGGLSLIRSALSR